MSIRDSIRKNGKPGIDSSLKLKGEPIYVRALSGAGRSRYMAMVEAAKENGGVKPEEIAALGLCEKDGTLAYDLEKSEDLEELRSLDGAFLSDVSLKLFEISGLATKEGEDPAKNSQASPNDSSGSGSPSPSAAP